MTHHRALIDSCAADDSSAPNRILDLVYPMFSVRIMRLATVKRRSWLAVGMLTLGLTLVESLSYGIGPLPQIPCPCAADGICRPNRGSWGYSKTRWRAWPGDQISQQPAAVDQSITGDDELRVLPPFETPLPEDEDLRGPAKDKADKSKESSEDAAADDEPAISLPGPAALPGAEQLPLFDPQGNSFDVPQMEDAPPALPASLRQSAQLLSVPPLTDRRQPPASQPPAFSRSSAGTIRPVGWQQSSLALVNPATTAGQPEANTLRQAIYYEASDLDEKSDE